MWRYGQNHSCVPNCQSMEIQNREDVIVLVLAIRQIDAGEKVTVD